MTTRNQSWPMYPETILTFDVGARLTCDLRKRPTAALLRELCRSGLSTRFAVVTACNPRGERAGASENQRRTYELRALIGLQGLSAIPADGGSSDGRHVELGYAANLSKEDARRISTFFEQTAFFWFDGRRFWIEPATMEHSRVALPIRR